MRPDTLDPSTLVIFGATGDLARRKLVPALYSLLLDGLLPPRFAVVAVGRRPLSGADFDALLRRSIDEFSSRQPADRGAWDLFVGLFRYHQAALDDPAGGYGGLRELIDHVQITSAETGGVGDRVDYYDNAGALRDMVQNHMCQLLAMVAMEPPSSLETEHVRDEKVKVLSVTSS